MYSSSHYIFKARTSAAGIFSKLITASAPPRRWAAAGMPNTTELASS
jgi:hypothetical protein